MNVDPPSDTVNGVDAVKLGPVPTAGVDSVSARS